MTLTFDHLLATEGIDPPSVHLARHKDNSRGRQHTIYGLWLYKRDDFELYQRIQGRLVFGVGNMVASFVVTPAAETLFVGLYRVEQVRRVPDGMRDPFGEHDVSGLNLYDLVQDKRLAEYVGTLTIDWGKGFLSWAQRAGRKPKRILSITRAFQEDRFPGYLRFIQTLSEIPSILPSWKDRLTEAKGVYLLTCPRTHEHYVGSATGLGGFYERWMQHAAMEGDAVRFRSRDPADYQVSILEVAGSSMSENDIVRAEQLWMRKLQSTSMGLNAPVRSMTSSASPVSATPP